MTQDKDDEIRRMLDGVAAEAAGDNGMAMLARMLMKYYSLLVSVGFYEDQALQLSGQMQSALLAKAIFGGGTKK